MQRFAVRMSDDIEPGLVVEASRLDDEGVAVPSSDGIAQEGRELEFLRKRSAVAVDLSMQVTRLIQGNNIPE